MSNTSNNANNAFEIDYPDNPKMEAMISIIRLRETLEEFFELTKFEEKLKEYGLQNHLHQHLSDDDLKENNDTDKFINFTDEILDTKLEDYGDFEKDNAGYSYTDYLVEEIRDHCGFFTWHLRAYAYGGYDKFNVDPVQDLSNLLSEYKVLNSKFTELIEMCEEIGEAGQLAVTEWTKSDEHAEQLEHTLDLYRTYAFDVDDQAN